MDGVILTNGPVRLGWEYPASVVPGIPLWRLITNGVTMADFTKADFKFITTGTTNFYSAQTPPFPTGEFKLTLLAVDTNGVASDPSNEINLTFRPPGPSLTIKSILPFEVTFTNFAGAEFEVQGADQLTNWVAIGRASERTPGKYYFLHFAPMRTSFLYRVKEL